MPAPHKTPAKGEGKDALFLIDDTVRVRDLLALFPRTNEVLEGYGIHCASCAIGGMESIREGCALHGFEDEMIAELLEDLSTVIEEDSAEDASISLTKDAAEGVLKIAKTEKHVPILTVTFDEQGAFCMEFQEEIQPGDAVFHNENVPDVTVAVSPLLLRRIGGAVIDFRDGRFKLDLPDDTCACAKTGCPCDNQVGYDRDQSSCIT